MKSILKLAAGAAFLTVAGSTAFAAASIEMVVVSGGNTDIIFVADGGSVSCGRNGGSIACSTFGTVSGADTNANAGVVSLSASNLDGWSISTSTGASNSPNCSGVNGPNCLNAQNITAQATHPGTLTVYTGDTGYTVGGSLLAGLSIPAAGIVNGTVTQSAFAFIGALGFSNTAAPSPSGAFGGNLTLSAAGSVSGTGNAPASAYSQVIKTVFSTTASNAAFNATGAISANPVPEPTSMILFGTALAFGGTLLRRKLS